MTIQELLEQNQCFKGTGGISQENHSYGFLPAFLDTRTGVVYISRFADGRIAPMHLLGSLPPDLIKKHTPSGQIMAIDDAVTAGFVHGDRFYTREQAARAITEHTPEVV